MSSSLEKWGGFQLPCRFWPYPARSSSIQTSCCIMMWILFHQPVYWEGTIVLKTDHWISTKGWSRWHMPSFGNCHLYIHALWSRYVSMYTYNIYIYTCYMILYCNEEQDIALLFCKNLLLVLQELWLWCDPEHAWRTMLLHFCSPFRVFTV